MRPRKHMCLHHGLAPKAQALHERWIMDFIHDQIFDDQPFRVLTVIDQWSRQSPILEPGPTLSGRDVAVMLDCWVKCHRLRPQLPWITEPNSPRRRMGVCVTNA